MTVCAVPAIHAAGSQASAASPDCSTGRGAREAGGEPDDRRERRGGRGEQVRETP